MRATLSWTIELKKYIILTVITYLIKKYVICSNLVGNYKVNLKISSLFDISGSNVDLITFRLMRIAYYIAYYFSYKVDYFLLVMNLKRLLRTSIGALRIPFSSINCPEAWLEISLLLKVCLCCCLVHCCVSGTCCRYR